MIIDDISEYRTILCTWNLFYKYKYCKISASLQETLHNHKSSSESTNSVEALEMGSNETNNDKMISASLQETLHNHNGGSIESTINVKALEIGSNEANKDKTIQKDKSIFQNWPLMSSIIVYCVFSLHDVAYQEVVFLLNDFSILTLSLTYTNLLSIYHSRFSHCGLSVPEDWVVWALQLMLLVMFLQYQVHFSYIWNG